MVVSPEEGWADAGLRTGLSVLSRPFQDEQARATLLFARLYATEPKGRRVTEALSSVSSTLRAEGVGSGLLFSLLCGRGDARPPSCDNAGRGWHQEQQPSSVQSGRSGTVVVHRPGKERTATHSCRDSRVRTLWRSIPWQHLPRGKTTVLLQELWHSFLSREKSWLLSWSQEPLLEGWGLAR